MKDEELKLENEEETTSPASIPAGGESNKDDKDGRPDPFIPKSGPTNNGSQYEFEKPVIEDNGAQ